MRRIAAVAIACVLSAAIAGGQTKDYFTELEISDIRDAQEIDHRTEVLLQIAGVRLAGLGLIEADDPDDPSEPGAGYTIGKVFIRIFSPSTLPEIERMEQEQAERAALGNDISSHSREELLRGFSQALEETMDNIDDAYERKGADIRKPVETLRDFAGGALELLETVDPESEDERSALSDAIEQSQVAFEGARSALEILQRNQR